MTILAQLLAVVFSFSLFADIPSRWEPDLAKAALDFHDGRYDSALSRLDRLPSAVRNEKEARELRALTLRRMSRWEQAAAQYEGLIRDAKKQRQDARPYLFELGVIRFEQKNFREATRLLSDSYRSGFNRAAATYFLGIISLEQGRLDQAARRFRYVLASNAKTLRPVASLYLAQIEARSSRTLASLKQYSRASQQARLQLRDPHSSAEARRIARQVVAVVDKVTMSLRQATLSPSVGLVAGYDSNVLFAPNNITSPAEGPSGRGSFHNTLQYGLSYATAALAEWQTIVNFQGALSYHFNRNAEQGDYIDNDISVYFTNRPLGELSYGMRAGVAGALRNAVDSVTQTNRFRTYVATATIGPYAQYSLTDTLRFGAELAYQPRRFFLDSETSATYQQTGALYFARLYLRDHRGMGMFNPAVYLSGNITHTRGIEFRSSGLSLALSNRFHLSDRGILAGSISVGSTSYKDREGADRYDVPTSLGVNYLYQVTENLDLFGDLIYTYNFSNVPDPYEYNRYRLAVSGNYRF